MKKFAKPAKRTGIGRSGERRNRAAGNNSATLERATGFPPARGREEIDRSVTTVIAADDDDGGPEDMDEFRLDIVRRIQSFLGCWRDCDQPICKRARACRGDTLACAAGDVEPTPQQWTRQRGKMYEALQRAMAKYGCNDECEPTRTPPSKRVRS